MTDVDIDELGPVDWIVVEFPGVNYGNAQVAAVLEGLVDRRLVRILDLLFLTKRADGVLEPYEIPDLGDGALGDLRWFRPELAMVVSERDVLDLAKAMNPGTSAVVLVWANLWAAPFGSAIQAAGGQLVGSGRIPPQAVISAILADDSDGP